MMSNEYMNTAHYYALLRRSPFGGLEGVNENVFSPLKRK